MKKFSIILFLIVVLIPVMVSAQYFDYRLEESPAISWNGIQSFDARLMSLGGISLLTSEAFSAVINPALIPENGKFILGLSGNRLKYESFQYWGVNEGVYTADSPFSDRILNFGGLAASISLKKIRFSAGCYLSNLLEFPDFFFRNDYEFEQYSISTGLFPGKEYTFFAAAAYKLHKVIDFGIKLDYATANREVQLVDFSSEWFLIGGTYIRKETQLEQLENHKLAVLTSTLGVKIQISPKWIIGTSLVYPFNGKAKRTITRTFENISDNFIISNTEDANDTLHRPEKIYLGTKFTFPIKAKSTKESRFIIAAESKYTFWSGYRYIFFDEEIQRDMKNTLDFAVGVEYGLINPGGGFFLRMGFRLDPQPLVEPDTTLKVFSGGIGVQTGKISADLGFSYYYGVTEDIGQNHFVLSSTLSIKL